MENRKLKYWMGEPPQRGNAGCKPTPYTHPPTTFGLALYRQAVTILSFSLAPIISYLYFTSVIWISSNILPKKIHQLVRQVKDAGSTSPWQSHMTFFAYNSCGECQKSNVYGMFQNKLIRVPKALVRQVHEWIISGTMQQ